MRFLPQHQRADEKIHFVRFPSSSLHVTITAVRDLHDAIARAQAHLLDLQAPDGHWVGQLEANTTITSEFLLLCHLLDHVNHDREVRAVRYLRRRQLPDGGWNLFEAGPTNLSATIKAYFAMKMAGVGLGDPAMVAAREIGRASCRERV